MASVEERLRMKRGQVDTWSTKEKLCLASSVVRSGSQNWMSVSRSLRSFGGEPGRPADWFSQKSCAVQYDNLLTQIETPKRKKRGADGSKTEGVDLTPAEIIVKHLTGERIEELRKLMTEARAVYAKEKEEIFLVQNGLADDRYEELLAQIQEEKKQKEAEQEEHQRWLRQREERKQVLEMAWRPHAAQQQIRASAASARRPSNQSELGSETDNVESPSSSDQPTTTEEPVESKPVSTPTSPLLTSLLKSPSPVTGSQSSSILHSAITSQRGASPTITSLLNSSPGVPNSSTSIPLSPNLKTLVSNALAGHDDIPKSQSHSASSSSPTLSMLLELPPSTPGKLPELPYSATKQPATTSKSGESMVGPPVETLLDGQHLRNSSEQSELAVETVLVLASPKSPEKCQAILETVTAVKSPNSSEQYQPSIDAVMKEESLIASESYPPAIKSMMNVEGPEPSEPQELEVGAPKLSEQGQPTIGAVPGTEGLASQQHQSTSGALKSPTQTQPAACVSEIQSSNSIKFCQPNVELNSKADVVKPSELCQKTVEHGHCSKLPLSHMSDECTLDSITLSFINQAQPKEDSLHIAEISKPSLIIHPPLESESHLVGPQPSEKTALQPVLEVESESSEHCQHRVQLPSEEKMRFGCETQLPQTHESKTPRIDLQDTNKIASVQNPQEIAPEKCHTAASESDYQEDLSIETPPAPDTVVFTANSEAKSGELVDPIKKEPLLDINNMKIVMPEGSENKVPETKDNSEPSDLQQLSNDELEYVVDPSILQEVQEFVPEGLVDEMVFIVSSDDVEGDVNNMLETAGNNQTTEREEVESKLESNVNRSNEEIPNQEPKQKIAEEEPVPVLVHTSPLRQSPQRTNSTPSSVAVSPRGAGRPAKGSMVARKIVMEEDDVSKVESVSNEEDTQQLEGDSETLDLQSAGILLLQDNGEVVKLTESGQTTSIMDDIHVIQDSSNGGIVVVPHEDIIKDSEMDSNQSLQSSSEELVNREAEFEREVRLSPKKDEQLIEQKSPSRTSHKDEENSVKNVEDSKENSEDGNLTDLVARQDDIKSPEVQEDSNEAEVNAQDGVIDDMEDMTAEDESLVEVEPPPSPSKREKSPDMSESSNEVASEEDNVKEEVAEDTKKDDQMLDEKEAEEKIEPATPVRVEDEETRHVDSDVHVLQIKEEKRADTPSTEDDNTREEPPPPVRRGRGRYARDNMANSDSVPNSPVPSNVSHDNEKEYKAWKKSIMLVYNRIAAHKNASIFLKPITDDKVPGYSSMIFKPSDLQTIKKKIETGDIRSTDEFQRDILLMFNNAIMYNKSNSPIHDMAREMQEEGSKHLEEYKSTQLYVQNAGTGPETAPLLSRRGTRTAEKRDPDSDGYSTRRGAADKSNPARGVFNNSLLGKRKRSIVDDRSTPKRRKEED